jgi:hypothetical protein
MKKKELPEIFKKILDTFKNFLNFIGAKLKKFDTKEFYFFSDIPELISAYEHIVNNKYFIESLNKLGYVYIGKVGRDFKFKKEK